MAVSRRLVKSRPSQIFGSRVRCSGRTASTGCSGSCGGFMPSIGLDWRSPLDHGPLEEGVQASVAVVGGGRLPADELVGDELLERAAEASVEG
jgi:hypothetical protein